MCALDVITATEVTLTKWTEPLQKYQSVLNGPTLFVGAQAY